MEKKPLIPVRQTADPRTSVEALEECLMPVGIFDNGFYMSNITNTHNNCFPF
jgi:hypothetical protein